MMLTGIWIHTSRGLRGQEWQLPIRRCQQLHTVWHLERVVAQGGERGRKVLSLEGRERQQARPVVPHMHIVRLEKEFLCKLQ
jgi:hypothetical protein